MQEDDWVGIPFLIKKIIQSSFIYPQLRSYLITYLFVYLIFNVHKYFFKLFTYPILTIIIYLTYLNSLYFATRLD